MTHATHERRGRLRLIASGVLLLAVAIWGVNFVVVKEAVARWPVMPFLVLRFWIATLFLLPFAIRERRASGGSPLRLGGTTIRHGGIAGLALFAAYMTQTYGIQLTHASVAAFLSSLFVVFVPLLLLASRSHRPDRPEIVIALLAIGGVAVFNFNTSASFRIGSLLLVACALAYAVQIIIVGSFGRRTNPVEFTTIQIATIAIAATLVFLPQFINGAWPQVDRAVLGAALFSGVLASAVAYLMQTWAQRHISPTQTAVILSLEPVVATVTAAGVGTETLTASTLFGGLIILSAVLMCSLHSSHIRRIGAAEAKLEEP